MIPLIPSTDAYLIDDIMPNLLESARIYFCDEPPNASLVSLADEKSSVVSPPSISIPFAPRKHLEK